MQYLTVAFSCYLSSVDMMTLFIFLVLLINLRVSRFVSPLSVTGFLCHEIFLGAISVCNVLNAFSLVLFYPLTVSSLLINWLLVCVVSGHIHQGTRHSTSTRQFHNGKSSFLASVIRLFFLSYTKDFCSL